MITAVWSCVTINVREKGKIFKGIDKTLQPYVKEYDRLIKESKISGVSSKDLSAGFRTLEVDKKDKNLHVIGLCRDTKEGPEILLDPEFWKESSDLRKTALAYHELTHCLCGRPHTHPKGTYKEADDEKLPDPSTPAKELYKRGYFQDMCATSIMHPVLPDYECLVVHWEYYEREMLEGCGSFSGENDEQYSQGDAN